MQRKNSKVCSKIKVVGIDPGLAGTGVGLIHSNGLRRISGYAFGSIKTSSNDALCLRLEHIYSETLKFLNEQSPDIVVLEDIFSLGKYPGSGITLGKVTGVLLLAACQSGATTTEISVREAKKIISGTGSADKHQVEKSVRSFLDHPEPIRPFHASDALALAIAGFFRYSKNFMK
ncbi:Crossover junction endodeoxyribonuclease RuvC [Desulfamplus magnetovallimortis]|uniref:Crossover junction endodeoxyribonuclease RuvC n=1 Tax=Desulfamplus magnetovallimortis TaxID=1246637 RepID=A0A1W1HKH9_9BACT|nr:crossover junction endodeoxyribonuclease RuvC [Desulfamplus magnetovallimortis]SLM32946.1 Crossover junction endodeoxyribonuclease RuvC [Desulfamplus magnetovallimortis]